MANTEMQENLGTGTCERCGGGVELDEEGRLSCAGCGRTTDRCSCAESSGNQEVAGT